METRRRGRDARANTESNRLSSSSPTPPSTSVAPNVEPPSTRSRTRRAQAAQRTRRARTPRTSSSAALTEPSGTPQSNQATDSVVLPVKTPPLRRQAPNIQTAPTTQNSATRTPVTRKRTRSATRTQLANSRPSPPSLPDTSPPAATPQAVLSRPSKRPRRATTSGRSSKVASSPSNGAGPSQPGVSSNRTRGMSSDHHEEGGDNGNSNPISSTREEEGPSSIGSDRGAPTTLQGLLRRLGADLSDILPSNAGTSHSRLQQLRTAIASPESGEQQIDALSELCEFLSVGTEESLVSFSVNLFVSPLVNLLRTGSNVEIKIYAARALTHMMEALPSSSSAIAINGAAGPLCQNLLSIEYIDLAEQSLSALHKLSVDYPQQIVSANGFQAVLSYIDFFSIGIQRVAASTVCNLCRLPRADAMEMISGVLPTMMRLLSLEDQRIRESAVLGFTRLAEAFKTSSEKLETLCGEDSSLLDKVLGLVVPSSPPALSPHSYSSALRLLALLSRGSARLGLRVLSTTSLVLKLQSRLGSGATVHSVDCLNLADSLLPDIPESDGAPSLAGSAATRTRRRRNNGSAAALAAVDIKRREQLEQDSRPLLFFGETLFNTLMKFYVSSADSTARKMALSVMSKFIAIASEDVLTDTIAEKHQKESQRLKKNVVRFCPFVAALLGENSSKGEALVGLAMAAAALQKIPSLRETFVREGVIHEIVRLAALDQLESGEKREKVALQVSGGKTSENGNDGEDPEVSREGDGSPERNQDPFGINGRDMDSVWTAVAALQRGGTTRAMRGNSSGSTSRLPARSILEFRVPSTQSAQALVPKAAHSILTTYLEADSDGNIETGVLENSVLERLSDVCCTLESVATSHDEGKGDGALTDLFRLLTTAEGLTVFEVSKSRLLEVLSAYLSPRDPKMRATRVGRLAERCNADVGKQAFDSLVALTLGVLSSEEKLSVQTNEASHTSASSSVSSGLRQLAQPFKLRLRKAASESDAGSLRDYSHHVVLIEPLATMGSVQDFLWPKVRDSGHPPGAGRQRNTRNDRSTEDNVTGDEIDDAGNQSESGVEDNEEDAGSREDRFTEMFDTEEEEEEGQMEPEEDNNENHDDEDAMEEENEEQNSDGSDEDVSSGEEDVIEQDGGESDEHEHEGTDSLDVDQLGSSLPPFEVDHESLGQAPGRFRNPSEATSRQGSASQRDERESKSETTFRSYAAALAANMGRTDRDVPTGRPSEAFRPGLPVTEHRNAPSQERKLLFSLNGKPVAQDSSILTAIIQSASDRCGIGPRLWSEVHTLSYSRYSGKTAQSLQQKASGDSLKECGSSDGSGPVRRSLRILEHKCSEEAGAMRRDAPARNPSTGTLATISVSDRTMHPPEALEVRELSTSMSGVVNILNVLHWIHCGAPGVETTGSDFIRRSDDSEVNFVSHKLSAKLVRQLSDPLALCGGVIPSWCFSLTREAAFLFPFENRRMLFQSTSLGVPRALHSLQTRTEMAGTSAAAHRSSRTHREGDARIARITRQKVRVHRNRILESAIKVMNMYSSHSTVLEVEYFQEVGTGLGPTLEFYSMASLEIQRVDLGLWRCNAEKLSISKRDTAGSSEEPSMKSPKIHMPPNPAARRRARRLGGNAPGKVPHSTGSESYPPPYITPTGRGLFPSCLPLAESKVQNEFSGKTNALFAFIGRLIGKAVIDCRLLDLRFSSAFSRLLLSYCRVVYEQEVSACDRKEDIIASAVGLGRGKRPRRAELDRIDRERVWEIFTAGTGALDLLREVDSQLANSLNAILDMVRKGHSEAIPSLCLTFVLPGDDCIELIPNGSSTEVNAQNAEDFVRRVTYHVLFGGVYQQAEALLSGLEELIDVTSLLVFEDSELELLICGPAFEEWTVESLVQATRCDHGYSHESSSVLHLLKILADLSELDQQRFVRFITGSPALPLGGLRNLHPRLTIVRRTPEAGRSPDECLPTVMTCTNYLKLPDYSTFEIAEKQIMYAIREGQGAFHLS